MDELIQHLMQLTHYTGFNGKVGGKNVSPVV